MKLLIEFLKLCFLLQVAYGLDLHHVSENKIGTGHTSDPLNVYRSYQTSVYCATAWPIQYPQNAEELQEMIRSAIASGNTVKVLGGLNSITDIICTEGIPISTKFLNSTELNPDGSATFGAGIQLADALQFLHERGRALEHIPTYGGITIGGAIGTGAHGSSLLHPTALSDQILKLTLIDGKGELRTISEEDGDDFRAVGVHLGLLGAVVSVTLRTVPDFKMTVENTMEPDNDLYSGRILEEARKYDLFQLWWLPNSQKMVVSRGTYVNTSVEGEAHSNLIPDLTQEHISLTRDYFEGMQALKMKQAELRMEAFTGLSLHSRVIGRPPIFAEKDESGERFVNPATGYAMDLQAHRCLNKCIWDADNGTSVYPEESAFAFDFEELPKVVKSIERILMLLPGSFPMIGIFIRFSKGSRNLMSIGTGRDTVHMEWTSPMRADPFNEARSNIATYQAILQAMLNEHGGRPHWGKNGAYYFTSEVLQKSSPNLERFQEFMSKFDPEGVFLNKFGRRVKGIADEVNVDPLVSHCALQDICLCMEDGDCADGQVCEVMDGKYRVCLEKEEEETSPEVNEVEEESNLYNIFNSF